MAEKNKNKRIKTPATLYCRQIIEHYQDTFASEGIHFGMFNKANKDILIPARTRNKGFPHGTQLRIDLNDVGPEIVPQILERMTKCCTGFTLEGGELIDRNTAIARGISSSCCNVYIAPTLKEYGFNGPLEIVFMANTRQYKGSKRVRKDGTVAEQRETRDNFRISGRYTPTALGFTAGNYPDGISYNEMHHGLVFSNLHCVDEDTVGPQISAIGPMLARAIDTDCIVRCIPRECDGSIQLWDMSSSNRNAILAESSEVLSAMHFLKHIHKETGIWMCVRFYESMTNPVFDYEVLHEGKVMHKVSVKSGNKGGACAALSGIEKFSWDCLKSYSGKSIPPNLKSFLDFAFCGMVEDFLNGKSEWVTRSTKRKIEQHVDMMLQFAKTRYNCSSSKAFLYIWNAFNGKFMDPYAWSNASSDIVSEIRIALQMIGIKLTYSDEELLNEVHSGRFGLVTYYIGCQMVKDINANTDIQKGLNIVLHSISDSIQSNVNIYSSKTKKNADKDNESKNSEDDGENASEVIVSNTSFADTTFELAFYGSTLNGFNAEARKFGFHWHMSPNK